MSRPAKAGATDEVRPPRRRLCARAMRAGRVPRMPRWLRQPRHGSRAWYCPFTLASGSDPRHESRVALLASRAEPSRAASSTRRRLLGSDPDDTAAEVFPLPDRDGLLQPVDQPVTRGEGFG